MPEIHGCIILRSSPIYSVVRKAYGQCQLANSDQIASAFRNRYPDLAPMRLKLQFERQVPAKKLVRAMRRATRKHHSAEDEISIVLKGLRDEEKVTTFSARSHR